MCLHASDTYEWIPLDMPHTSGENAKDGYA